MNPVFIFYPKHSMGIINREGALYMATGFDTTGLYASRREAIGIIKAMASQITSFDVFSGLGISAATAFASAAKSSYDFEKEFRKNMLEVATISTQVTDDMTGFMNQVMSITQQIPIKAPEAAKALYQIVSAGHDGADGMKILEVSAKSAVGGLTDTATAADAITTVLNAYKMSADQAENISDQLFTTVRLGKTDFGQLGQSIAQVAPIAASYGVEIDQVLAAVASLTKQGTPTAQAMTQIRAAIIGTSKVLGDGAFESRTFQEALAEVATRANGSESKLRELVPEIEAVNGVLGMTGINAKTAASDLGELQNAAGATEAAFEKMKDEAGNQMTLLANNIQATLRPMGEAILKEVADVAKLVNEAFENGDAKEAMRSLGDLIVIVTGAFIGYKGAVLASTTVQNLYTRAMAVSRLASIQHLATTKLLTNAIKAQTVAALKNVAALAINPYVLAAAAISFLGFQVYKYATQATAAEKAQRNLNARWEEQKKLTEERKTKTEELLNVAQDETQANIERNKALKTLKELYPQIFAQYELEELKLADILQLKKQISEQDVQRNYQSDKDYFASLAAKHDKLNEEISYRSQNYGNGQHKYGEFFNKTTSELKKEWEIVSDEMNKLYANLKEKSEMIWETSPREVKIISLEQNIASLKKEKQELEKLLSPNTDYVSAENTTYNPLSSVVSPDAIARLNVVNNLLQTQSTQLDQLNQQAKGENKNEETVLQRKIKLTKELAVAEAKLKKLRASDSTATDSEIDQAEKEVEKKKKALKALTGLSEKEGNKIKQTQTELSRSILESELKLQSERLSIMQDGKDKRVLLADQEYKETLATIQKERDEYLKQIKETKGKEDPAVLSTFDNRESTAKDKRNTDVANINKEYVKEFSDRQKEISAVFLSEEAKRLSAIKDRYDKERLWAKEQHKTGGLNDDEYELYSNTINEAETEETLKALLDKYQDYDAKRLELEKNYTDEIATLSSQRTETNQAEVDAAIAEAGKRHKEELTALDFSEFQDTDLWKKMFGDLDKMALPTLENILQKAKEVNTSAWSPDQIKEYQDAIDRLEEAVRTRSPFKSIKTDWQNLMKALKEGNKDGIAKAFAGIDTAVQGINSDLNTLAGGIGDIFGDEAGYAAGQVAELTSAIGGFATGASKIASGDILGGITSVVSSIGSIFSMGKKVKEMNRAAREEQQKFYDEARAGELEYQALLRERLRLTQQIGETSLEYFDRLQKELHKQSGSISEEYDEVWAKLMGEQYIEKVNYKHGTWFRKAKTWNDYGNLAGKTYEEIESLYTQNKLTDSAKVLFEQLQKLKEEGADVVDMMDDLNQSMSEAWTGTTEDTIAKSILDGIAAGKSGVDDLTTYFRDMMKSAMLQGVNMKYLQAPIKKFYEQFAEMSESDGMLTESEIKQLQEMYTRIVENAEAQFENLQKISGLDFSTSEEETSDNSLKGAFAKASQESIDLIGGQFGAMRVAMETIREQMQFIRDLQTQGWRDVATIKDLVGKLREISDRIDRTTEEIKKSTDNISDHSKRTVEALESTLNVKVKM